ncbi:hypothetical protein SDC9_195633 [bioreactor metagenome]|uniref:Uncharacterized protein n=1 Tax=bioreactor metagenome TaxID=1076179 RepID=A0A645IC37_9ZZZZ
MIPVIEVDAVHIAVHRVEVPDFNTRVLNGLNHIVGKAGEVPKVVKNYMDFHAGGGPFTQRLQNPVPDFPLGNDEILQKDIRLRLLNMAN